MSISWLRLLGALLAAQLGLAPGPVAPAPRAKPAVAGERPWQLGPAPARQPAAHAGARAGVVFDLGSGRVLWERAGRARRPIASLTKLMSALLVVERLGPRSTARVPRAAVRVRGSGMGLAVAGTRLPVESLLRGLLVASGNDAAVALAVRAAGSERAFVRAMNRRARRWELGCTRFVSVHGLGAANRSCPRDLAVLTRRALARPRIAAIVARRTAPVRLRAGGPRVRLVTTNPLLRARVRGTLGVKTGWAPYAGRCLAAVVRRDGRRLGIVLLDAPDRLRSVRALLSVIGRPARRVRAS